MFVFSFVNIHNITVYVTLNMCVTGASFCGTDTDTDTSHKCQHQRRPARAPADTNRRGVAAELLASKCACDFNCTFRLNTTVHDLVDRVIDARDHLQTCGRTKSSEALFTKLLPHRRSPLQPGGKYVVHFFFAGFEVCGDTWCVLHGLRMEDTRMKQVLATLRHPDGKTVWIPKSKPGARGEPGRPSWRGDWCRAWMRTHVKKFVEFNPAEKTASLDPEPIEVRHMLYARDWESRPPGSKTGTAICERHFRTLWEEICSDGYPEGGSVFKIKIRPARSQHMSAIDGASAKSVNTT